MGLHHKGISHDRNIIKSILSVMYINISQLTTTPHSAIMISARLHVLSAIIAALIIIHGPEPGLADDIGTNFFLKASKSVPRIGRRSMDFDNHFLKASKSVPRIGRRGLLNDVGQMQDVKGFPIIRNVGPEVYLTETGQPLWSDFEKAYESSPRLETFRKLRDDSDGNDLYWARVKRASEIEEPRYQQQIY